MNFLTKTRVLIIAVIFLSVLLISVLATIGYKYYSFNRFPREIKNSKKELHQPGEYFAKTLDLTNIQRNDFRNMREEFHRNFDSLDSQSRHISKLIMEELTKENSRMDTLNILVEQYASIQKAQKMEMVKHFLEIKGKCTPEQRLKFSKMLCRMNEFQQNHGNKEDRMRRGQNPRNINKNQN